jgi:myo-inositol-1(or 4)-monophosphatase
LWCLDPVDGTSNYAAGIPYYTISLGLIENGESTLGIVYDLSRDECFVGIKGEGAYLNNVPLKINSVDLDCSQCSAIVDFKRLPKTLARNLVTDSPYLSQRNFGSIALEWCWLAASRGHLYLHGSQNIWDFIAGNLIFSEAGGISSTFDGEPVYSNELKPRSAIAALDNRLFKEWFNWVTKLT